MYGWKSKSTLANALSELIDSGFIKQTRKGGRNKCSLYAVSWLPIGGNQKVKGGLTALPHNIFRANLKTGQSAQVSNLTHSSFRLLVNLTSQLNKRNNGNLTASPKIMTLYGWKGQSSLIGCISELLEFGFIEMTKKGVGNQCSFYAVTWLAIDECGGKINYGPTSVPSNLWKKRMSLGDY